MLDNGDVTVERIAVASEPLGHVRYVKRGRTYVDERFKDVSPEVLELLKMDGKYVHMPSTRKLDVFGHSYELALLMTHGSPGTYSGVIEHNLSDDTTIFVSDPGLVRQKKGYARDLIIPSDFTE